MPGFELIGQEEKDLVNKIFENGGILMRYGFDHLRNNVYMVNKFEKRFANTLGSKYALAVTSGTAALKVGLKALGIGPGDEVITQSHTFIATVEAILECGATPVMTEINETLNMCPEDLKKRITPKTKAIIPVHMLGVSCQMNEIIEIANMNHIPVLEDTAQAVGGKYNGKCLGTIGQIGCYSFDFGKALTTGEGGMVVSDNEHIYQKAIEYHDHGHENNPNLPRGEDSRSIAGFNYRMMEIQGAIGLAQLGKLNGSLEKQKQSKHILKQALSECENIRFRHIPDKKGDTCDTLVFFLDTIDRAKNVAHELKKQGIGTKNLPDAINWHFSGTWDHIFDNANDFWKHSETILRKSIALPIFINMDSHQIELMADKTLSVLKKI